MDSSVTVPWQSLFSAELSAAVTLLGLVFVGLSINLGRIIASGVLIDRSLEAVFLLLALLVVATVALVPQQTVTWLGWETVAAGLAAWCLVVLFQERSRRHLAPGTGWNFVLRVVMGQIATLAFIAGGAMLVAGNPTGLGAVTVGMLFATISAVVDSWVLLVEILR